MLTLTLARRRRLLRVPVAGRGCVPRRLTARPAGPSGSWRVALVVGTVGLAPAHTIRPTPRLDGQGLRGGLGAPARRAGRCWCRPRTRRDPPAARHALHRARRAGLECRWPRSRFRSRACTIARDPDADRAGRGQPVAGAARLGPHRASGGRTARRRGRATRHGAAGRSHLLGRPARCARPDRHPAAGRPDRRDPPRRHGRALLGRRPAPGAQDVARRPRAVPSRGPARLVLVTCGGRYDAARHSYEDNIVVQATPLEPNCDRL